MRSRCIHSIIWELTEIDSLLIYDALSVQQTRQEPQDAWH